MSLRAQRGNLAGRAGWAEKSCTADSGAGWDKEKIPRTVLPAVVLQTFPGKPGNG
jgi:hypothetical protein